MVRDCGDFDNVRKSDRRQHRASIAAEEASHDAQHSLFYLIHIFLSQSDVATEFRVEPALQGRLQVLVPLHFRFVQVFLLVIVNSDVSYEGDL